MIFKSTPYREEMRRRMKLVTDRGLDSIAMSFKEHIKAKREGRTLWSCTLVPGFIYSKTHCNPEMLVPILEILGEGAIYLTSGTPTQGRAYATAIKGKLNYIHPDAIAIHCPPDGGGGTL